jgi:hypothetical protein
LQYCKDEGFSMRNGKTCLVQTEHATSPIVEMQTNHDQDEIRFNG